MTPGAVTTSATGTAVTGGVPDRARTATSAECGGGTSSTRRGTRNRLALGELPVGGSEELTAEDEHMERVMLTARLRTGLPLSVLSASERLSAEQVVVDGLAVIENDHVVLTDRGRLRSPMR